ncbi:MAG: caspase family protein [Acidobacteria bacterium]|nr:caspase family protein [Acidobacteriota bacterium]
MQKCTNAGLFCILAFLHFCILSATPVFAGERYALVITGASGGDVYAQKYQKWRAAFTATLGEKFGYAGDRLLVLAETESQGVRKSTRENVRRALGDFRQRMTKDDQLLVLLIGHGTSMDGDEAKFNLVGPDLSAADWADLLRPIPGRLVFINSTGASFPFLRTLAGRGRIVLTATDNAAQQYETVFPEYFVKAFDDPAADLDKNGRVSIWEAFTYASAGVQQWFEQKGQLPTERPLLDDTGAGVGREALNPGVDGAVARVTYLAPDAPIAMPTDSALAGLMRRRADLEQQLEELKARKESMPPDQYATELEKLLIEISRVSAQIRSKS